MAVRNVGGSAEPAAKSPPRIDSKIEVLRRLLYYATGSEPAADVSLKELCDRLIALGIRQTAQIEVACHPAVVWMADAGIPFDAPTWKALAREAKEEVTRIRAELDARAPPAPAAHLGFGWTWDRPDIVQRVFRQMGIPLKGTSGVELAAIDHPLADALRRYRRALYRATTVGENWLQFVQERRIYPQWVQIGAATGRMQCQCPNIQGLLRDPSYRACIAAPRGRVLLKADYSQIELRIAACLAQEKRMIQVFHDNGDLHRIIASSLLGKPERDISPEERRMAKAVAFGLLYGMGAARLCDYALMSYGVKLMLEEAERHRRVFFETYPELRRWQRRTGNAESVITRTRTGRVRNLMVADADEEASLYTRRLNTPIQGLGADGLKIALGLLHRRREECPGAVPAIACHDEIVVECDEDRVEEAKAWLRQAMLDGMSRLIEPVPVVVDLSVGQTWAG